MYKGHIPFQIVKNNTASDDFSSKTLFSVKSRFFYLNLCIFKPTVKISLKDTLLRCFLQHLHLLSALKRLTYEGK